MRREFKREVDEAQRRTLERVQRLRNLAAGAGNA